MVPEIPYRHTVPETPDFPIPSIPFRNPPKSYTVIPYTYVSRLLLLGHYFGFGENRPGGSSAAQRPSRGAPGKELEKVCQYQINVVPAEYSVGNILRARKRFLDAP